MPLFCRQKWDQAQHFPCKKSKNHKMYIAFLLCTMMLTWLYLYWNIFLGHLVYNFQQISSLLESLDIYCNLVLIYRHTASLYRQSQLHCLLLGNITWGWHSFDFFLLVKKGLIKQDLVRLNDFWEWKTHSKCHPKSWWEKVQYYWQSKL